MPPSMVVTDTASVVTDANGYVRMWTTPPSPWVLCLYRCCCRVQHPGSNVIADAYFSDGTRGEITVKDLFERDGSG